MMLSLQGMRILVDNTPSFLERTTLISQIQLINSYKLLLLHRSKLKKFNVIYILMMNDKYHVCEIKKNNRDT